MKLKQTDIFNFNVDEIELYGTFSNYETLIEWVNSTNSDFIKFLDFTVKKSDNLKDYHFKLEFWKNNYPCYAFYVWKQLNAKIKTRDYFIVYWSAFKIIELNEIVDFIDTYLELDYIDQKKWNRFNTLKRFDLAIDIKKDISEIVKNFNDLTQKWAKYFWNKWELETYYIWEYKKRNNKRLLIRIYDKLKDIKQKQKQDLYGDYLLEENITRIELEFRKELISSLKLNQLLDRSYIYNLLILYLNKHTKIFDNIKTKEVEKLKATNKKVNLEELKYDDILKDRYITAFLWYARNILKIWSCPVDILLSKSVISDLTNKDIIFWMEKWVFNSRRYVEILNIRKSKQVFAKTETKEENANWGD
jgi:hypothetical protein